MTPGGFWSRTFESLSVTNFRYLWFGSLLGMSGFQMQAIARTILVDELTEQRVHNQPGRYGVGPDAVDLFDGRWRDRRPGGT